MHPKNNPNPLFEAVARERFPDDTDRLADLRMRLEQRKIQSMKTKRHLVWIGLAGVILAAAILLIAPYGVQAVQRLLGYIPDLGVVEEGSQALHIASPTSLDKEGVQVTVEKGVSDGTRTVLLVQVENASHADMVTNCPLDRPQLLAGGETLAVTESTGHGTETGFILRLVFPALPPQVDQATLVLPCLLPDDGGGARRNWEQPLAFAPLDPATVAEVIELPPTQAVYQPQPTESVVAEQSPQATPTPAAPPFGIALRLERAAPVEDGYALMGSLSWTDPQILPYGAHIESLNVLDASGQTVAYDYLPPDAQPAADSRSTLWAFKIVGKDHAWPLTLQASVSVVLPTQAAFTFDAGPNPQAGQVWALDQRVSVLGSDFTVKSVTAQADSTGSANLEISYLPPDVYTSLTFAAQLENGSAGGGGGGGGGSEIPSEPQVLMGSVYFDGPLPSGSITILIPTVYRTEPGPWQIQWQP